LLRRGGLTKLAASSPKAALPLGRDLMAHTIRDKTKLLNRVRRIRGQIDAVHKALEQEQDCSLILMTIAACRGAIHSLMAEVIEFHFRYHVVDPDQQPMTEKAKAAQELIDVIKAYLK
jgi:DNA-binding FrmR family transcriptional regulator